MQPNATLTPDSKRHGTCDVGTPGIHALCVLPVHARYVRIHADGSLGSVTGKAKLLKVQNNFIRLTKFANILQHENTFFEG